MMGRNGSPISDSTACTPARDIARLNLPSNLQDELMRAAIVLCTCLLSACLVKPEQSAQTRVHSFYSTYLMSLTRSDNAYSPSELREYVSADTLKRLDDIESIPEQDLIDLITSPMRRTMIHRGYRRSLSVTANLLWAVKFCPYGLARSTEVS